MMTYRSISCAIIGFCVYLTLIVAMDVVNEVLQCDKWKCPGPLVFYKTLNCTPVYKTDNCCADWYNCDHIFNRIAETDKFPVQCYLNGHEYRVGERVRQEDEIDCAKNCICRIMDDGMPDFYCNYSKLCTEYMSNSCHKRNSLKVIPLNSNPEEKVCSEVQREERPVCEKFGKIYLDQEYMLPEEEDKSDEICKCQAGKNNSESKTSCEPFSSWFDPHSAAQFYRGCTPIYTLDKTGVIKITKGYWEWRCQEDSDDIVDRLYSDPKSKESRDLHGPLLKLAFKLAVQKGKYPEGRYNLSWIYVHINPQGQQGGIDDCTFRKICKFGQRTMSVGNRLYSIYRYIYNNFFCIVCTCEVPPIPTCITKLHKIGQSCEDYNYVDKIAGECDKMKCPGPLPFYKQLNCKPVYESNDCCPDRYNCDHKSIENIADRRCYLNGHEYKIGEKIRKEDETHCKKDCICINTIGELPDIYCNTDEELMCPSYASFSLYEYSPNGCYRSKLLEQCCQTKVVCPKRKSRPHCEKFGKIYFEGEHFELEYRPGSICECRVYDNGTSTILCTPSSRWYDIHAVKRFQTGCAPVYIPDEHSRLIEINRETWRCPDFYDVVVEDHYNSAISYNERMCIYGLLTMNIGEHLNNITYGVDGCIFCTCEVPPVPTCILLKTRKCRYIQILF